MITTMVLMARAKQDEGEEDRDSAAPSVRSTRHIASDKD